ncbi:hypothetical protein F5884DRAFT_227833 [Xylogone sp. PMI_703]|nr:hypothetical protein F5884DRAFT_227833 [Xylogone sp. PMI_703]
MSNTNLPRREHRRACRIFLHEIGFRSWGFVLYRTIYTPESETLWPLILAKLNAYIYKSIWYDYDYDKAKIQTGPSMGEVPLDPEPNARVCAQFKNLVLSDEDKFSGVSIGSIRRHFVSYLEMYRGLGISVNRNVCLVVDESVFNALRDAPVPLPGVRDPEVWVKVVDGDFEPDDLQSDADDDGDDGSGYYPPGYPPGYEGWCLSNARLLWSLYGCFFYGQTLGGSLLDGPRNFEGEVFRFRG